MATTLSTRTTAPASRHDGNHVIAVQRTELNRYELILTADDTLVVRRYNLVAGR